MGTLRAITMVALFVTSTAGCNSTEPSAGTTTTTASASTTPTPSRQCSAATLSEDITEPDGIPTAVAMMRKEILKAAVQCDYKLLEALALRGDGTFQYSYGQQGPKGASEYWGRLEAEAAEQPPLEAMVKVLAMPFAERQFANSEPGISGDRTFYSWPSADQEERSDEDWDALRTLYTDEQVSSFRREGNYVGYRLGITESGDWIYFVAGD